MSFFYRTLLRHIVLFMSMLVVGWPSGLRAADGALMDALRTTAERDARLRAEQQGFAAPQVRVSLAWPKRDPGPCASGWQLSLHDAQQWARPRYRLGCDADGRQVWVPVRVEAKAPRVVLRASALPGHTLVAGDLELAPGDLSGVSDGIAQLEVAIGRTLGTRVRAGQALQMRHLGERAAVQRGQQVQLVSGGASFRVSMSAAALDQGAVGSHIRVRNLASGKVMRARVVSEGMVEVAGAAPLP